MCCEENPVRLPSCFLVQKSEVEVSRDVEAVIWFFGAFCSCLPAEAATAAEAASHAVTGSRDLGCRMYNVLFLELEHKYILWIIFASVSSGW